MRIDYILKASAKRMANVNVDVDRPYETVCISTTGQDDIVMQGDDAAQFIGECDKLATRCKCLDGYTIESALAEQYAENLWN